MKVHLKKGLASLHYCASGGVARIFTAQMNDGRYTVKMLRRELVSNDKALAMFKREISTLRTLRHRQLPELVEFGFALCPYYAYRYVEGISVLQVLRKQHFPIDESTCMQIVRSFIGLFEVLDYLHSAKHTAPSFVHGDISPENLIQHSDGSITLIDLGSAQILGEVFDNTRLLGIGKPSYMSPEQAQGLTWDHRSDLYQAGMILYEMLFGRKFIRAASAREAILIASNPPPPDFPVNLPRAGADLRAFLETILQPDPGNRYQTAAEAAVSLAGCLGQNHAPLDR